MKNHDESAADNPNSQVGGSEQHTFHFYSELWNLTLFGTMRTPIGAQPGQYLVTMKLQNETASGVQDIVLLDDQEMFLDVPNYFNLNATAEADNTNSYILSVACEFTAMVVSADGGKHKLRFSDAAIKPTWTIGELDLEEIVDPDPPH